MPRHYEHTDVRRRQIADAALHVIAEQGLAQFTSRAIAARLEISDGTLFRHFKNKREIVLAAMERLDELMFDDLPSREGDPVACLERFFRARATLVGDEHSVGRLVFSDQLPLLAGEEGELLAAGWIERTLGFLAECVGRIAASGQLAVALPIPAVVQLIQGQVLTFALIPRLPPQLSMPLQDRVDMAWMTLNRLLFR